MQTTESVHRAFELSELPPVVDPREQEGADLLLVLGTDPAAAAAEIGAVLLAIRALAVLPGALARRNSIHSGARGRQVLT
ncbi:hypothetical protein PLANPX_1874 [Lacipirellula parvula]|uniref:Uncharacterized protein n=1 Tax=Lacipirellula parvula TaxID=2650471 RepID=A0A5K7X8Q7_9BACT|nr:hypothetical protein PLANPX_1874 [Lacipirellula parvula]